MKNNLYETLFYETYRIRLVEEKIADLYPTDKIESPVHLSIGQEHIPVALCNGLSKTDLVFGTYRGHALYLAKGGDLNRMFAELFAKRTGCGGGKAGSMHLSDVNVGVMGCSAVVATTIPNAVGAALAAKVKKTGQIILSFFGEAATGNGVYHESLNFASKHKLPILFICENNNFSIYTRVNEIHSYNVSNHSRSYGIETTYIDNGYDLLKLKEVGDSLITKARKGDGPQFLEISTYRYRQHVGPVEDYNIGYREIGELKEWQKKDPVIVDTALAQKFRPEIEEEISKAIDFAEKSPFPTEEDLYAHVI